jgi:hypothetical protein
MKKYEFDQDETDVWGDFCCSPLFLCRKVLVFAGKTCCRDNAREYQVSCIGKRCLKVGNDG